MRSLKLSGHLDGRVQERFMVPRSLKPSGPLERMAQSPKLLWSDLNKVKVDADEYDEHSLWTKLFNDMKPT
ncbi:SAM domain-containing protein [Psidium guajava]|nr:SAM domain-containing protein [Psidium guajava]